MPKVCDVVNFIVKFEIKYTVLGNLNFPREEYIFFNLKKGIMSDSSRLLEGIILGGIIGVAAGLLLAPESGKETRGKLKDKADDIKNSIDEKLENMDSELIDELKSKFEDIKEETSEEYKKVAEKVKSLEKEIEEKIAKLRKQANNLKNETV